MRRAKRERDTQKGANAKEGGGEELEKKRVGGGKKELCDREMKKVRK